MLLRTLYQNISIDSCLRDRIKPLNNILIFFPRFSIFIAAIYAIIKSSAEVLR